MDVTSNSSSTAISLLEVAEVTFIVATLNDIIGNLKYKKDRMSEERTREFYIKEGFRLVRNEKTEFGDNLKNSYNSDYNIEVFYASGDWKGIS